jgi:hypothetical protein
VVAVLSEFALWGPVKHSNANIRAQIWAEIPKPPNANYAIGARPNVRGKTLI